VNLGSTTTVTFTFTTDDGNPATSLLLTSDLTALPAGWSTAATGLSCPTVSTGATCQISLNYSPALVASGTLSLNYSYADDSGTPKTGSVSIGYLATVPHLYVAQIATVSPLAGSLEFCLVNGDGSLSNCAATGSGFVAPTGIAFYASDFAYVADFGSNQVFLCIVGSDGSLSNCAPSGSNFEYPVQLAISGSTLYATSGDGTSGVTSCAIGNNGALSGCTLSSGTGTTGIAVSANYAYIGAGANAVDVCPISPTGILSGTCAVTAFDAGFSAPDGIAVSSGYAYIASLENGQGAVTVCAVNATDGSLSGCTPSLVGTQPAGVALFGSSAYVDDNSGQIYLCAVGAGGALGSCAVPAGGTGFDQGMVQIAVH